MYVCMYIYIYTHTHIYYLIFYRGVGGTGRQYRLKEGRELVAYNRDQGIQRGQVSFAGVGAREDTLGRRSLVEHLVH